MERERSWRLWTRVGVELRIACAVGPGHLVLLPTHVPKGDATWVWAGRRGHCVPRVEKQPELLAGNSGHRGQGPAGSPPQGPSACHQWGGATQMTLRDWKKTGICYLSVPPRSLPRPEPARDSVPRHWLRPRGSVPCLGSYSDGDLPELINQSSWGVP